MTFDLEGFKSKVMWIPSLTPITHKQGQFGDGLETAVHKIGGSFTYNHLGFKLKTERGAEQDISRF